MGQLKFSLYEVITITRCWGFPNTLHGFSLLSKVEANYFGQCFLVQSQELNMTVLLEMPVKAALVEINLAGCVEEFAFC